PPSPFRLRRCRTRLRQGRRKHRAHLAGLQERLGIAPGPTTDNGKRENAPGDEKMILLAKVALGFGTTLAVAGAYTFREGVLRVDVDEFREGGSHVHMWVPAAVVPMALHVVPKHHLHHASF